MDFYQQKKVLIVLLKRVVVPIVLRGRFPVGKLSYGFIGAPRAIAPRALVPRVLVPGIVVSGVLALEPLTSSQMFGVSYLHSVETQHGTCGIDEWDAFDWG